MSGNTTEPTANLIEIQEWIDDAAAALEAATVVGIRSCVPGDGLNYANHDRLVESKPNVVVAVADTPETRYWVTPVDNPDALGDYGGFTFQTYDEAVKFIEAEYAEHERLRREGYYEDHETPDLLQVETVVTVKTEVVPLEADKEDT